MLGWKERPGMYQVIGVVFAIVGLAVVFVTCGALAYLAATGTS